MYVEKDAFGMPKDWPFKKKVVHPGELYEHKTKVGRYEVSSIHLGMMGMEPDCYETMIFDDITGETDCRREFSRRHRTPEEAEQWHAEVVGKLKAEVDGLEIVKRRR